MLEKMESFLLYLRTQLKKREYDDKIRQSANTNADIDISIKASADTNADTNADTSTEGRAKN